MPTVAGDEETVLPGARPRHARGIRRTLTIVLACVVVVALLGGGWALAEAFESPDQREARATAPVPAAVTAAVVSGNLERTVSARAIVGRERTAEISVPAQGDFPVVTSSPLAPQASVTAGTTVLEVNGQPVFAMPGAFPFFRDLTPGMKGPDVAQLQRGLTEAGLSVAVDGEYGASTDARVRQLYARAGYTPQEATSDRAETTESDAAGGSSGDRPAGGDSGAAAPSSSQVTKTTVLPRSALMVFSSLPAVVESAPATGATVTAETSLTVGQGRIVAVASLEPAVAGQMQVGMRATVQGPDGQPCDCSVTAIAPSAPAATAQGDAAGNASTDGTAASSAAAVEMTLAADADASLPAEWFGADVLVVITVEAAAESSLIVPSVSVVSSGSDRATVYKKVEGGDFLAVEVRETASLSGRSAVVPRDPSALSVDDIVKVG